MKVFVTGGAGYIGSVTTKMLLDEGHEVIVFDNLERGHREAVDNRALFIKGDLRDSRNVERAMLDAMPEAVMHFAAYALVGESISHPEWYFGNNVLGGINLSEAMLKARVKKIIFSSSCATYGNHDTERITEDTVQQPVNPYGESKLMFEKILFWYRLIHKMEPVFLRYFNVAGASLEYGEDHDPETHLIPNVLDVAFGGNDSIKIFGDDYDTPDGTCIRDYIHVCDLARAHIIALTTTQSACAVNLGAGRGYSVLEVVETARAVTGCSIPVVMRSRREGDPSRLIANIDKAEELLKWVPERSDLPQIIESAWTWLRDHPNGYRS